MRNRTITTIWAAIAGVILGTGFTGMRASKQEDHLRNACPTLDCRSSDVLGRI